MAEEGKKPEKAKAPANTRRSKRGAEAPPPEEDPDALMTATLRAMEWAGKRRKQLIYLLALIIGGSGLAYGIHYYRAHREEQATSVLSRGATAMLGPIKSGEEDPEIVRRLKFYGNESEKLSDALAAYSEAASKYGDTGPGILARLGEAGVYLDKRDWDQAIAKYTEVKGTSLAAADSSIRLRCIEGLGYAREGKGLLDDARAAFVELANLDVKGAKALGLYHQARIDLAKGDRAAATEKLKTARADIETPGGPSNNYLRGQIDKLLGRLDPSAVPKPAAPPGGIPGMPQGAGPGGKLTKEQIDQFLKAMQQQQGGGGGAPPGGAPPGMPPPPPAPPAGNP
jgi:hypothetical protein